MTGAGSTTSVAGVRHLPPDYHRSAPPSGDRGAERRATDSQEGGALASAGKALGQLLSGSGFLDFRAPMQVNFRVFLICQPPDIGMEDIDSGAPREWILFVRNQVALDAARSMRTQARIRPEAAVRLLR